MSATASSLTGSARGIKSKRVQDSQTQSSLSIIQSGFIVGGSVNARLQRHEENSGLAGQKTATYAM
jgi:hypothetical protein